MSLRESHLIFFILVSISCRLILVRGFYCTNELEIEQSGLLNYLANVTFHAPVPLNGEQWNLEMDTDSEFTFLGVSCIVLAPLKSVDIK